MERGPSCIPVRFRSFSPIQGGRGCEDVRAPERPSQCATMTRDSTAERSHSNRTHDFVRTLKQRKRRAPPLLAGSTGDPPVPSDESPDGTGAADRTNDNGPFTRLLAALPVGESPALPIKARPKELRCLSFALLSLISLSPLAQAQTNRPPCSVLKFFSPSKANTHE
jgi:hypothetical protein